MLFVPMVGPAVRTFDPPEYNCFMLATVAIETTKTIAATATASCPNDNCQLRFMRRNHELAPLGTLSFARTAFSASIVLLIRNQSARSFGTASYSPRCSCQ